MQELARQFEAQHDSSNAGFGLPSFRADHPSVPHNKARFELGQPIAQGSSFATATTATTSTTRRRRVVGPMAGRQDSDGLLSRVVGNVDPQIHGPARTSPTGNIKSDNVAWDYLGAIKPDIDPNHNEPSSLIEQKQRRESYAARLATKVARREMERTYSSSMSDISQGGEGYRSTDNEAISSSASNIASGEGWTGLGLAVSNADMSRRKFGWGSVTSNDGSELFSPIKEESTWYLLRSAFEVSPKTARKRLEENSAFSYLLLGLRLLAVVPAVIGSAGLLRRMLLGKEGERFVTSDSVMCLPWVSFEGRR